MERDALPTLPIAAEIKGVLSPGTAVPVSPADAAAVAAAAAAANEPPVATATVDGASAFASADAPTAAADASGEAATSSTTTVAVYDEELAYSNSTDRADAFAEDMYDDEERALAAEAERLAEAEGLSLLKSDQSMSGFLGVCRSGSRSKPFISNIWKDGRLKNLGRYATAEEASLAYARALGPEGVQAAASAPSRPSRQAQMSAEEALATADREGLTLHRSESSTGFKGVSHHLSSSKVRPFHARVMRGGKTRHLGNFATAEEAALAHARALAADDAELPMPQKRRSSGGEGAAKKPRKKKGDAAEAEVAPPGEVVAVAVAEVEAAPADALPSASADLAAMAPSPTLAVPVPDLPMPLDAALLSVGAL
jgi:hypothetical protein